jgi:hypothetical protein
LAFLFALSLVCCSLAEAQSAGPAAADDPIEKEALKAGPVGSPGYVAALRAAIENEGARQIGALAGPGGTKSLGGAVDQPARAAPEENLINRDPRYLAALRAMQRRPARDQSLDVGGGREPVRVKSVGASRITTLTSFPEVAISFEPSGNGPQTVCSGTLLEDRRTLLTAGHCICFAAGSDKIASTKASIQVRFGTAWNAPGSRQPVRVQDVRLREGVFCPPSDFWSLEESMMFGDSLPGRDIAVLRLAMDIPADWVPAPMALPDLDVLRRHFASEDPAADKTLNVVGYGHTTQANTDAGLFKTLAKVPVVSFDCQGTAGDNQPDSSVYRCSPGTEMVAEDARAGNQKVGPCQGDSGGGAFVEVLDPANGTTRTTLSAIVSRSVRPPRPQDGVLCGDGAVYTLLTVEHVAWVRAKMAEMAR